MVNTFVDVQIIKLVGSEHVDTMTFDIQTYSILCRRATGKEPPKIMTKILRKVFPGGGTSHAAKLAAKPEAETAASPAAAPAASPAAAPST